MKVICKIMGHSWVPYKWTNHLSHENTRGQYVMNLGGEYKEYICLKCGATKNTLEGKEK